MGWGWAPSLGNEGVTMSSDLYEYKHKASKGNIVIYHLKTGPFFGSLPLWGNSAWRKNLPKTACSDVILCVIFLCLYSIKYNNTLITGIGYSVILERKKSDHKTVWTRGKKPTSFSIWDREKLFICKLLSPCISLKVRIPSSIASDKCES